MVQSASNSNTQCPSGRRRPSSARVAEPMLACKASPAPVPICAVLESISVDISAGLTENFRLLDSSLAHGQHAVGGAVSGPYRSLDGRRQPRISPVAREEQVFV